MCAIFILYIGQTTNCDRRGQPGEKVGLREAKPNLLGSIVP